MGGIEIDVMVRQGVNRRMADILSVRFEVVAWRANRDQIKAKINWQFTTDTARTKLKRFYTTFGD